MSATLTAADQALELLDAMDLLFNETKVAEERRGELRVPFFRPVSVTIEGQPFGSIAAFSRDLSPLGIGLVHNVPLETGEVVVSVPVADDQPLHFRTEICWAQPFGKDWYISGGRFLSVVPSPYEKNQDA